MKIHFKSTANMWYAECGNKMGFSVLDILKRKCNLNLCKQLSLPR